MHARSPRMAILLALAAGCAKNASAPQATPVPMQVVDQSQQNPAAVARADKGRPPFVDADVKFMQGMIHHHAQAILISKWAPTHGASDAVQRLCERIGGAPRRATPRMSPGL